jgi:polysaccharide biosynthesis/export protein
MVVTLRALFVAIVLALAVGAIDLSAQATYTPSPSSTLSTSSIATTPNYVIGPGDRLRITVWNQENVSGEYVVAGDGSFTFPLIGRVVAGGLTVSKLETELKRLLANGFYRDPQVTASMLEYRSKRVFVIGSLHTPGAYPLTGDMNLIEALARAGSTTPDAADHLFIIHSSAAAEGPVLPGQASATQVMRVDLRLLNDGATPEVHLEDGDTLFVPRAATVFVYGQVTRPGAYPIGEDTTVRQALSLAGGATEFGAVNRATILRSVSKKEQKIPAKLDDRLKPGDTIVIPERLF